MSSNILFELGTEELPPKSLKTLSVSLSDSVRKSLETSGLSFNKFESFCSPRRLAFVISDLDDFTAKNEVKVWGPPAKIAFDENGKLTKAAEAFCSRNNITAEQIQTESDGKVEKIFCLKSEGGESSTSLLPAFIQSALDQLPIAKRMRWGASRTEFVRPAQWLVLMQDANVIPAEILGQSAGKLSRGHRFLSNNTIEIKTALSYEEQLKTEGKVVANFEQRKNDIEKQVKAEAEKLGGHAIIDADLLDEVSALVEWPVALSGKFDSSFLDVPAEALISSMKEHQKYFHVVDADNKLLPLFITVSNIEAADYSAIISGNEKVIRPRLADAAFFFETDKKQTLTARREKLKNVVFQAQLGSIFDKTERISKLASQMAETLGLDSNTVGQCAELCKSDLVSNMVYEFPEMQGIAGYHYALNDGLSEEIAAGINEHYQPKFAGDALAESDLGSLVGLADRLDTLSGIFAIGQQPSGSKDPFALRRASLSVLRIIVGKSYDLDLSALLDQALQLHSRINIKKDTKSTVLNYILERFKAWFEDQGIAAEVWQAVSAKALSNPMDINKRVHAIHSFYQTDSAIALAAANKRVANILAKNDTALNTEVDISLFQQNEENVLHDAVKSAQDAITPLIKSQGYQQALEVLSTLREAVDNYFDQVMVMDDDKAIRINRLTLLNELRELFLNIADIRFLAPGK